VVYATCSLLDEENEGVVSAICSERDDVIRLDQGQFFLPPESDGFYVAVLERRPDEGHSSMPRGRDALS
jgi:16S rRNA C967 or C1407 C5-methylase (RsmB/RsmF family)